MLDCRVWFGTSLYLTVLIFAVANFPWWIVVPLVWGHYLLGIMLDTLNAQGKKENFEALNAGRT